MRQLENLTAYEVVEEKQLDEMNATGTVLRHKKSGARIFAVSCEDENKVFSIGFRTQYRSCAYSGTQYFVRLR